jgi:MoaA/NifB/PqqE/SkfB family radical SAM enzyme
VLEDAAGMGYKTCAVSGGEPLLYADLSRLLHRATVLGMRTTVTTNGTVLNARTLDHLVGVTSLVAVSVDGTPELHNEIRGAPRAFATRCFEV